MMKATLVLIAMVVAVVSYAQPNPDTLWTLRIGGDYDDNANRIRQTLDGGYIAVGRTYHPTANASWMFIVRIDGDGDTLWTRRYGGAVDRAFANDVLVCTDGGFLITGLYALGGGSYQCCLWKIDYMGDIVWIRTYGVGGATSGRGLVPATNGGYIIVGHNYTGSSIMQDIYVIKVDTAGNEQWNLIYGGQHNEYAYAVDQTTDGGYIVAGDIFYLGQNHFDIYLLKLDQNGNPQWTRTLGGLDNERAFSIKQTSDGGYIMAGQIFGAITPSLYIVKTDSNGDTTWTHLVSRSRSGDRVCSVEETGEGNYLIADAIENSGYGESFYLAMLDDGGQQIWERYYGGNNDEYGSFATQTNDGGFILAGSTESFGAVYQDMYIVKTGPYYAVPRPQIELSTEEIDFGFTLLQQPAEQYLTIYNVGDTTLVLNDIYSMEPCFGTLWNPTDSLIYPGDSLAIAVMFAPDDSIIYNDFLYVENNDHLETVVLTGQGVPDFEPRISLSSDSLYFGFVEVGTQEERNLTVHNTGFGTMVLYDFSCSSTVFNASFNPADSLLDPGDSMMVIVTFAPEQHTLYQDTLRISNNAQLKEVALSGYGIVLGVEGEESEEIPENYALQMPYPNPFNVVAMILYDVPVGGMVRVEVYDILGRNVATLVDGDVSTGRHEVVWDAMGLPSGIYFVSMAAREFRVMRKVVLLK